MNRTIKAHPPVSKLYAQKLVDEGVVSREQVDAMIAAAEARMREAHEAVTSRGDLGEVEQEPAKANGAMAIETAVPAEVLKDLNEQLLAVPDGFTIHPKLLPSSSAAVRPWARRAASPGRTPSPWRSPRCSPTGSRCG